MSGASWFSTIQHQLFSAFLLLSGGMVLLISYFNVNFNYRSFRYFYLYMYCNYYIIIPFKTYFKVDVSVCPPLHMCVPSLMHSLTHVCVHTHMHAKRINGTSIFWVEKHHRICINVKKLRKICNLQKDTVDVSHFESPGDSFKR